MGYNRSGVRRTARMKRHKRLQQRLAERASTVGEAPKKEGLTQKVKDLATGAAAKVGEALHAAAEKIKGVVK
jgi:hypothetical protein